MMRRCIDSGRREFGMVASPNLGYGTMLYINQFEQLADGRSLLDTIGTRRFKILAWGQKDGYATAKVEWMIDHGQPVNAEAYHPLRTLLTERIEEAESQMDQPNVFSQLLGPLPEADELLPYYAIQALYPSDMQVIFNFTFLSNANGHDAQRRLAIALRACEVDKIKIPIRF